MAKIPHFTNLKCPVRLFICSGDATQSDVFPISHLWAELQVDPALGPAAPGLGRPGALPAGLVQPCPNPRGLIHKHSVTKISVSRIASFQWHTSICLPNVLLCISLDTCGNR